MTKQPLEGNSFFNSKRMEFLLIGLSLLFVLHLTSMKRLSLTYDEANHLNFGKQVLDANVDRRIVTKSAMPFTGLNALPSKIFQMGTGDLRRLSGPEIFFGRLITVFFSIGFALFVFHWSKSLYGLAGGFLSFFLYIFSPNLIAHAQLITADVYMTAMSTISVYFFWKFLNHQTYRNACLSAAMLGVAQLAKYNAIFLYPIFALILLGKILLEKIKDQKQPHLNTNKFFWIKVLFIFIGFQFLIINLGFFFDRPFSSLSDYSFRSTTFYLLQSRLNLLAKLPLMIPYSYLFGLDWIMSINADVLPGRRALLYLLGTARLSPPFHSYYFVVYLFKEPIAAQIIFLMSLVFYFRNKNDFNFTKNELFLFAPIVFFTVYYNFFFNTQIGIRYFLPVFPFIYIFCGSLARRINTRPLKILLGALMMYQVGSVLSYHTHYLSYFNELVGNRLNSYKILADSNLDWGQNEWYLADYLKKNPDAIVMPDHPVSGKVVVDVNHFVGVFGLEQYAWLRAYKPAGHIAYSYLIFNIPTLDQ